LIYLDSSVALADLLAEPAKPSERFWLNRLTASRLLAYEVWTRINTLGLAAELSDDATALLETIDLVDLVPTVLERALRPFPVAIRTLDALHLATVDYLSRSYEHVSLATYDKRMREAGIALGIPLVDLAA
jgi:predicted nucleic acid-binding protein